DIEALCFPIIIILMQALVDLCHPLTRLVRSISSRPPGMSRQEIVLNSLDQFREDPICTSRFTSGKLDLFRVLCWIFQQCQPTAIEEARRVNYITLLRRLRLWDLATSFTNACAAYEDIAGISHAGTGVKTRCTSCGKECGVGSDKAICSHCHKNNRSCVVCGKNVKGLWLACQVCGHGGHVMHMTDWFTTQKYEICPSPNCGHVCSPASSAHRNSVPLTKC
ncbi:hypothetical protein FOZ63_003558, partial [Perkinsus olseni]